MTVRGLRPAVLAGAFALVLGLAAAPPAGAARTPTAPMVDYPSWDQVQAARGNEAATAATIATIDTLLGQLQADAARLGDDAVRRSAEAQGARVALEGATASAETLRAQAIAAAGRAAQSTRQVAQIAAAVYRSGGTDLTTTLLVTDGRSSADLLYRLGALGKLGGKLADALSQAETDRNLAAALSAQADVARSERERLSVLAQQTLATARAAESAANDAVATQQANLNVLFQQLATLKNTTVALEQQYLIGQQAANDPGTGGGGGGFVVPGSEVNDVGAARAYAYSLLAQNGFGPEQNDCLLWLWNRESGWRTNAYNAGSGAYGIPQSLPGSKMAMIGADWRTNYATQVTWGVVYITNRYGTPCGAWAHSEAVGWY